MACWVVPGCFLVPAHVRHLMWVVGVGACFGLGIKSYTSEHTVGFTFNTVLASTALVVVARTTSRVYWCGLCVVGCL